MIYTSEELTAKIVPIAEKYKLKKVWLFGSYARGCADDDSDIDLLIDTEGTALKSLFALGALYSELENALGKNIDLITLNSLQQETRMPGESGFRDNVWKERIPLYAAA